ncbi:MAG: hypothetical protein NC250_06310 [Alistipes senegalensis]|nr:hypothetical protein [Bacteroides cellulosilyticus]MCM1352327.1 hypothetical protein [Alistipes senegalensis]
MTREELTARLSVPRYLVDFAEQVAREVLAADAVGMLYALATDSHDGLSAAVRHRLYFRAAYVLEKVFFAAPEQFGPFVDDFFRRGFPACSDASARRHFGKIMANLLQTYTPDDAVLSRIAECAASWTVEPKTKAAVRIWCVEVLRLCRDKCAWVDEMWDDLLATLTYDASPAIAARMRNGWKKDRSSGE